MTQKPYRARARMGKGDYMEYSTEIGSHGEHRTTGEEPGEPTPGDLGFTLLMDSSQCEGVGPEQYRAGLSLFNQMWLDACRRINALKGQPVDQAEMPPPPTQVVPAGRVPSKVRDGAFVRAAHLTDPSRKYYGTVIEKTDTMITLREYIALPDITKFDDVDLARSSYDVSSIELRLQGTDGIILHHLENQFEHPRLRERMPSGWNTDLLRGMSQALLTQIALSGRINDGSPELAVMLVEDQATVVQFFLDRIKPEEWNDTHTKPLIDRITDQDQLVALLRALPRNKIGDYQTGTFQNLRGFEKALLGRIDGPHLAQLVIQAITSKDDVEDYVDEALKMLKTNGDQATLYDIARATPADRDPLNDLVHGTIQGIIEIGYLDDLLEGSESAIVRELVLERIFHGFTAGDHDLWQRVAKEDPSERVRAVAQRVLDRGTAPQTATT